MLNSMIHEYMERRQSMVEQLIQLYLEKTHLSIEDIELVEERSVDGLMITWYCQPRPIQPVIPEGEENGKEG